MLTETSYLVANAAGLMLSTHRAATTAGARPGVRRVAHHGHAPGWPGRIVGNVGTGPRAVGGEAREGWC